MFSSVLASFLKETLSSPLFQGFWVCELAPVWELIEGLWLYVFVIQDRPFILDLEYLLICMKKFLFWTGGLAEGL
jgi:hypothetical protein